MGKVATAAVQSLKYLQDVRGEVKKITFPSWADLRQHTVAIIIVVTIIGVIIGLMDWAFSMTLIRGLGGILG